MVDDKKCLLWRLHPQSGLAKCREGLRAINLVHEVAVDVEQTSAIRLLVHEMIVPDLFEKRLRRVIDELHRRQSSLAPDKRTISS